jgi:hypothetical protein
MGKAQTTRGFHSPRFSIPDLVRNWKFFFWARIENLQVTCALLVPLSSIYVLPQLHHLVCFVMSFMDVKFIYEHQHFIHKILRRLISLYSISIAFTSLASRSKMCDQISHLVLSSYTKIKGTINQEVRPIFFAKGLLCSTHFWMSSLYRFNLENLGWSDCH